MFGIGQTEFIIILVFAFLLFGPDKLPQMGKTIGRALRQFRETQEKVTSVVQTEVIDPMAAAANAPQKIAAVDDDADAPAPEEADIATAKAEEARKETFAERRARLAAEKAAREAASEPETGAEGTEPADAEGAEPAGASAAAAEPAAEQEPAPGREDAGASREEDPADAVASLYARRPRKHREADAAAADDPEAHAEKGGEQ